MDKPTILNKLKLLDIRNPWSVTIVHELVNRRGTSARIEPLFKDVKKRLKVGQNPNARKSYKRAIEKLTLYGLLHEKSTTYGPRIYLTRPVWQLEDAIIESVSTTTIAHNQGRRATIQWKTILKEVRKDLSTKKVTLNPRVSKVLVYYFLSKRCGWRMNPDKQLRPPKRKRNKTVSSPEQQADLFE